MRNFWAVGIMFITICVCELLQANLFSVITLFGATANIGIILVGSIGLMSGKVAGSITGFIYGLIYDIAFGRIIGLYTGLFLALGIVSGLFTKNFSKESKTSFEVIISILTVAFETVTYLFLTVVNRFEFELQSMIFIIAKEVIYNMIIVLIVFKPISLLGEMINRTKKSYYLL